jgi:hypothetical protein
MPPHVLALPTSWIARGAFGLALVILSSCVPAREAPRPASAASLEQTSERLLPEQLEAPALERRLHLDELGASRWHQQGCRGQGVKVAILDSGFRDCRQFLGKGLPSQIRARSFRKDQNLEARDSQHGIFCAEVVHAIAPEAEILLANWEPDNPLAFLQAVRWARSEGARIISCSLIMPSWSDGEGGGSVHAGLNRILGDGGAADDLLCFASAGNTAERHWHGTFKSDAAGWHRWQDGTIDNGLNPWGTDRVAVEFYGPVRSTFEVVVLDYRTGELIGSAASRIDDAGCSRAVVRFEPRRGARYGVRVRCLEQTEVRGAGAEAFHLVVLGGALEHATSRGSIPFPGDGAAVVAVGAVDAKRNRLGYSSCGPNSTLPKPDFVASVPFPSLCRERPFAGTSAASPQAAGVAALVWSRNPRSTPRQVIAAMREAAVDLGPPGHDYDTGYGLIRLP